MLRVGTKKEVWLGRAQRTSGGLVRTDLTQNARGRVVSKRQQAHGRRMFARFQGGAVSKGVAAARRVDAAAGKWLQDHPKVLHALDTATSLYPGVSQLQAAQEAIQTGDYTRAAMSLFEVGVPLASSVRAVSDAVAEGNVIGALQQAALGAYTAHSSGATLTDHLQATQDMVVNAPQTLEKVGGMVNATAAAVMANATGIGGDGDMPPVTAFSAGRRRKRRRTRKNAF